jgi:hypothetical protein
MLGWEAVFFLRFSNLPVLIPQVLDYLNHKYESPEPTKDHHDYAQSGPHGGAEADRKT